VFAGLLVCLLVPPPAHAGIWEDLWLRPDQQARRALRDGEPDRAVGLFEDPTWEAVARYRAGDYPGAIQGFAEEPAADGYYNLGNALAFNGDYEAALEAYDTSLDLDPDNGDARYNRDIVARLLEEQQSAEQQDENEGDDGTNPENSGQPQDGGQPQDAQNQQPPEGEQADQPPETEPQESEQSDAEDDNRQAEAQEGDSNRDERQDALEQWLRRVPDDPGGLLRRKFQYETNQRLRRGDYTSRDAEQIW
jgi:Ca-activated chloride channel family protein